MGKRSNIAPRVEKDFYPTIDPAAVEPLIPFIQGKKYAEPCWGEGHLEKLLLPYAECLWASDLNMGKDALTINKSDLTTSQCDLIITNPPFSWDMLKPLLDHLPTLKPTWLLLPADRMHNIRMGPYMKRCRYVVSVGRLYWMENRVRGKDNYAWFQFVENQEETIFYGRG